MFDWLKRRMHRNDDIDDIRSNVIGERFDEPSFNKFDKPKFDDLEDPLKKLSDAPDFGEPPGFNTIDTRAPRSQRDENSYDILDRLNLIESQVAAIRSQTETINERLKNLDAKLSLRRY